MKPSINKLVVLFVTLILLGSLSYKNIEQKEIKETENQKIAEDFLEKKGYKIVEYKGKQKAYKLTNRMLASVWGSQIWGVQEVEPDPILKKN